MMGYRQNGTVDVNPDAIRAALDKAGFTMTEASRIIGMAENYISSLIRYGAGSGACVKRIADLCRVEYVQLIKPIPADPEPEPDKQPEKPPLPDVSGQTVRGLYDQLVGANKRLDDMERELRRLQAMEMRQERTMNQISAIVEVLTRWSDQITKITSQATGCNTNLLRLLALLEGKKRQ